MDWPCGLSEPCRWQQPCVIFHAVSTLAEIESAVDALPLPQQKELLRHLAQRLRDHPYHAKGARRLPLVPATGRPITQEDIDDALDAD